MRKVKGEGSARADIVIVGEAPGADEEVAGKPFVGASGQLLDRLLRESGIRRDACYVTNVCKYRPPGNDIEQWCTDKKRTGIANDWPCINGRYISEQTQEGLEELYAEVAARQPKIIIGLGNTALWAFTGEWGITSWRGSEIVLDREEVGACRGVSFVPTLHPAAILRSWPLRAQLSHDLSYRVARRLARPAQEPAWEFNIAPSLSEVVAFLSDVRERGTAAVDIETSRGRTVCVGLALSSTRSICIPFIGEGYKPYWDLDEYRALLPVLAKTLTSIKIIGQNFNYDASYFLDNFNLRLQAAHDTKIAQNVLYPGTPANLGFLASMYANWYRYWKDDARDWQNLKDFNRLFRYNCHDVCYTFEIAQAQARRIEHEGLQAQFAERMRYNGYVFDMQQRGFTRCPQRTQKLAEEIEEALETRAQLIADEAKREINPASPKQVSTFLYEERSCRKPARVGATSDEALIQVAKWHPEIAPFCTAVLEWRSLASLRNNFLKAKLDPDGKLRSSFLSTGTETFRLTSSNNNFGRGTNFLNITAGDEGNGKPNLRKTIVPPQGHTVFDCDLKGADLQVVVWEANDQDLKDKLRANVDMHKENAKDLFGLQSIADVTPDQRQKAKRFVHLTDYGGMARTCAIATGTTIKESEAIQKRWFEAHPGIKEWHERTRRQLAATRSVRNRFGYRIVFFDRVDDSMFRSALAWVPQSTIALVTSLIHMRVEDLCAAQVLLQMYDSLMGVYPTVEEDVILPKIKEASHVVIPYDDPLIIPMDIKLSTESWGECDKPAKQSFAYQIWYDNVLEKAA